MDRLGISSELNDNHGVDMHIQVWSAAYSLQDMYIVSDLEDAENATLNDRAALLADDILPWWWWW